MNARLRNGLGVLGVAGVGLLALVMGFRGVNSNLGYEPIQPIAYSHKVHAGDNSVPCLYCHSSALHSRHAGVPAAKTCMNCHEIIQKDSPEIAKIREALRDNRPIEWVKVNRTADFVYFNHQQHVVVGKVACQQCHGKIESMTRVRQETQFTMGWCIDCHRQSAVPGHALGGPIPLGGPPQAATVAQAGGMDCARCHY